jgi:hypothetical protein
MENAMAFHHVPWACTYTSLIRPLATLGTDGILYHPSPGKRARTYCQIQSCASPYEGGVKRKKATVAPGALRLAAPICTGFPILL